MTGTELRARLEESGRSQAALARFLGKSVHAVNRMVHSERELRPSDITKIENFFGESAQAPAPVTVRLPLYGYAAAAGEDRIALGASDVLDYIEVPHGLVRGPAIALRVAGDSMEPRLFSGEVVVVGLNISPTRDRDCVVEFRDGTGIIKQYKGQRDGVVFLRQYNPERELRIDASAVQAIHTIRWKRLF